MNVVDVMWTTPLMTLILRMNTKMSLCTMQCAYLLFVTVRLNHVVLLKISLCFIFSLVEMILTAEHHIQIQLIPLYIPCSSR